MKMVILYFVKCFENERPDDGEKCAVQWVDSQVKLNKSISQLSFALHSSVLPLPFKKITIKLKINIDLKILKILNFAS